ncbi:hypothetical protein [Gluconacetobacter takamatsuzukensis]|uniref:Uncharacterized protein n=1 Tax=Gluconacetobacter takamatsuzukensis TaxID=1286190 RepID=A0A7W4PTX5_9PROT|nr:hypothetical protein [Gluconacetobacter takamatsuzukensis]MBB2206441.1 hypothetical protein [Gluconacetobacter takamatsuzukensis]
MDLSYWMRQRTDIIRLFYDKGRVPFEQLKRDIEEEVRPWEPPYFNPETDDPEPAFLDEWMQADQTRELVGMLAVSLLADTLSLYFVELEREIGIAFVDQKERVRLFKQGKVEAYRQIIEHVMGDTFKNCPVSFDVIEQVILARNDFTHGQDFISFQTTHNQRTVEKHPNPFFTSANEHLAEGDNLEWRCPSIEISREKLMAAIDEVEKLANWVHQNDEAVWEWRTRMRAAKASN